MTSDKQTLQLIIDSMDDLKGRINGIAEKQSKDHDEILKLALSTQTTLSGCNVESLKRMTAIKDDMVHAIAKVDRDLSERIVMVRDEIFTDLSKAEEKSIEQWKENNAHWTSTEKDISLVKQKVFWITSGITTVIGFVFTVINVYIKSKFVQ